MTTKEKESYRNVNYLLISSIYLSKYSTNFIFLIDIRAMRFAFVSTFANRRRIPGSAIASSILAKPLLFF